MQDRRILTAGGKQQLLDTPGVYAFFVDGSISDATSYTLEERQKIIGVLVVDNYEGSLRKIVIDRWNATDEVIDFRYSAGSSKQITGATVAGDDYNVAMKDMNGKANTNAIVSAWGRSAYAAYPCQCQFGGQGHLPSCGEWKVIFNNFSAVNRMLNAIGGQRIETFYPWDREYYWTSTLGDYDADYAYADSIYAVSFDYNSGNIDFTALNSSKTSTHYVRAVLDPETYVQRKTPDTPGVYAYFMDGSTSTAASFGYDDTNKLVGFLVVDNYPTSSDLHKIVIDTGAMSGLDYSYRTSLSGTEALITTDQTTALKDMNGYSNTIAMKSKSIAIARECVNKAKFKGLGHLPSLGELKMIFNNLSAITDMASRFEWGSYDPVNNWATYFSSTLYDAGYTAWGCINGSPQMLSRNNTSNMRTLPVMNVD